MNGLDYIADTNAVVYLLAGKSCMKPYLKNRLAVSVITVMELLSFSGIDAKEEQGIRSFLGICKNININESIVEQTIRLRRVSKIKLPDAIIAATAVSCHLPLITADIGFFNIAGLQVEKILP